MSPRQTNREAASAETAACVLSYLRANASGDLVAVGGITIGAEVGVGQQTASRAIRFLIRDGWLSLYRKGSGAGYPAMYRIHSGLDEFTSHEATS